MRRVLAAAAAASLSVALLGAVPAGAADKQSSAQQASSDRAEAALAQVQAVFAKKSPVKARQLARSGSADATMALNELRKLRGALSPADRKIADAYLARPNDPSGGAVGDRYTVPEETPLCGPTVCIHYVATTDDAPPAGDANGDGVPDSVEDALATSESVNNTYTRAGYRRPKGDGSLDGGNNLVDIYLVNIGVQGLYGYCTSDEPNSTDGTYDAWAYCAIDNDFSAAEFGDRNTPEENQQVTLAHEYFHAVQFAYDSFEDPWFMEATATWAEDELFDSVNDNLQYLPSGQLGKPNVPLDTFDSDNLTQYGNWIFFRYLTEKHRARTGSLPNIVLRMWKRADSTRGQARDQYSLQAIANTLKTYKTNFAKTYVNFADANRRVGRTYSESNLYRGIAPGPKQRNTLTRSKKATAWKSKSLRHLTSYTVRVKPGKGLWGSWRLRTKVNLGPKATNSMARITTYSKSGRVQSKLIKTDRAGVATVVTPFSGRSIKHVELTIANGSTRTRDCYTDQTSPLYSCYGVPRDDRVRQQWKFQAIPNRLGS